MRVLLLGELSGVHQELAPALRRLGIDVTIGHSRQATDAFPSDIPFYRPPPGANSRWVHFRDIVSQLYNRDRLRGYDVVQVITPKFFNWKLHRPLMRYLSEQNGSLVIVDCSCSFDLHRRWSSLSYRACDDCKFFDLGGGKCLHDSPDEHDAEDFVHDLADAVVVTQFEYAMALADTRHASKLVSIPLPIDTDRHPVTPLPLLDPVRIFYGETRHGFKGGSHILAALDLVRDRFGGKVEIETVGRLPFPDYLQALDRAHIVIDQANSHSMGMNALYAMAKGRIALSGAEPESLSFLGLTEQDNAIINIVPDAGKIAGTIGRIVGNPESIPQLAKKSAAYIRRVHSADLIAARYTALYDSLETQRLTNQIEHRAPTGRSERQ